MPLNLFRPPEKIQFIQTIIKETLAQVQVLVLVQIVFEKCIENLYFENGEIGIKTTTANW